MPGADITNPANLETVFAGELTISTFLIKQTGENCRGDWPIWGRGTGSGTERQRFRIPYLLRQHLMRNLCVFDDGGRTGEGDSGPDGHTLESVYVMLSKTSCARRNEFTRLRKEATLSCTTDLTYPTVFRMVLSNWNFLILELL